MRIAALYKVWSGEEWLEASVESIREHVDDIYILTSDTSWIGGKGNPSLPVVEKLKGIHHIHYDTPDQNEHVNYGYEQIRDDYDYVQFIDSDELWDDANFIKAKSLMAEQPEAPGFRVKMHSYIKSPYFRNDREPCAPVCFIRTDQEIQNFRGCGIPGTVLLDVYCHHFVFVRDTFNKVLIKMVSSHVSENQPMQPLNVWIPEVWNKLPNYNREIFPDGYHPNANFSSNYQDVQVVTLDDLPEVMKKYPHLLEMK